MQELTLRKLGNTAFKDLYLRFLQGDVLSVTDVVKLLAISILLLNHEDSGLKRLGYRIVLFYGNSTGRYEALYDVALNKGLHPVSAVIHTYLNFSNSRGESFLNSIVSSYIDTFRDERIVLTEQQDALRTFVQSEYESSSVVVAPTSYGKSELIVKSIKDNPTKRVLVLVPSKALLAQTKKRLLDGGISALGKVVTHPEMYSEKKDNRVMVLTQERLSRLLYEHDSLYFDMVFVDEAHNILSADRRSELLAAMLCVLGARNRATSFKFLTPFLCDELNVRVRYLNMTPKAFRIDEYIKSERFYVRDFRTGKNDGKLVFYDHFLDEWLEVDRHYDDCFTLIRAEALSKNIIYGNKKKDIELFSIELASSLPLVNCPLINKACAELREVFDAKYRLIACLERGVMYHHGSIPDTIRVYLEDLFSKSSKMKYLVCNSTLLEGVNLPIERLFIFNYTKGQRNLTSYQFKNLIGRVNRFSDVFASEASAALKKLESSVYLLGVDGFTSKKANLQQFYKKAVHVTQIDQDSVGNVLLESAVIVGEKVYERFSDAVERLENLQPGVVEGRDCRYVSTAVGKMLVANGVSEIDVFSEEVQIDQKIEALVERDGLIASPNVLMEAIRNCFIDHFDESREYSDLIRLKQPAALSFYSMLLDWKLKQYSVKEAIRLTLRYWKKLVEDRRGDYVYVGNWGDTSYENSHYQSWVRISTKDDTEKINLAIVRLKEEGDFFDHKIFRFVEVLHGAGALDIDFYKKIKYGSADDVAIKLIRDGFSRGLASLIVEKYSRMIRIQDSGDVEVSPKLVKSMIAQEESDLLVFEARMNLGSAEV